MVVTFLLFFTQQSISQRNYNGYNHLGINGGITLLDIKTSDLQTKQGEGFTAGFTTRGAFYDDFDLIYGLNFYNSSIGIEGSNLLDTQYIGYTIQAVQLNFLASYNIIMSHLTAEFGPVLNINSKMKLDSDRYEDYILSGYSTLRAQDIQDISPINFHLAAGISGGFENFRISAQYQYGVTNTLGKLNDKNLENSNFEGHTNLITLAAVVYF